MNANRNAVGAKAHALQRLSAAGFNVPAFDVLTTSFFGAWLATVRATDEWRDVDEAFAGLPTGPPDAADLARIGEACRRVMDVARSLEIRPEHRARLDAVTTTLGNGPFAVRSSSPDEDLPGASFAGLYTTVLDVPRSGVEDAVRTCFASCLDAGVLLYKRQMGLAPLEPSMAVVVQDMVTADVAGAASSLNPQTNDFDEVVIEAARGVGAPVVSGTVRPDRFVVDATVGRVSTAPADACLTGEQALRIARVVAQIEALFGRPVDVEWAFAGDELHVLQARPVTSFLPLHVSMQTRRGEARRLYMDVHLTDGATPNATTPMSDDMFTRAVQLALGWASRSDPDAVDAARWGLHTRVGRTYVDVSLYAHLIGTGWQTGLAKEQFARYVPAAPPPELRRRRLLLRSPSIVWNMKGAVGSLALPLLRRRFERRYRTRLDDLDAWFRTPVDPSAPVAEVVDDGLRRLGRCTLTTVFPAALWAWLAAGLIYRTARGEPDRDAVTRLLSADCGDDEPSMQMAIALDDMASMLRGESAGELVRGVEDRRLSERILTAWDGFMSAYGHRGPMEMELSAPRFAESPELVARQIVRLAAADRDRSPRAVRARHIESRRDSLAALRARLSPRRARALERQVAFCSRYTGAWEVFRHHLMAVYSKARTLLLARAETLVAAGRLDEPADVFYLTMREVDRAQHDRALDLRVIVAPRREYHRELQRRVARLPRFIDSRGRIMDDTPAATGDGAMTGDPSSPGVARGPARILDDPLDTDVEPGCVLVAMSPDPSWTPLLAHAAGVVLELGGVLQHKASIAREWGTPCVSGVAGATRRIANGRLVEVDGDRGVVRLIDESGAAPRSV